MKVPVTSPSARPGRSLFPAALVIAAPLLLAAAVAWAETPRSAPSRPAAESPDAQGRAASPAVRMESAPSIDPVSSAPVSMPAAPLTIRVGKQALIAKDGSPQRIELVPGKPDSAVDLQAWTEDQTPDADGHYHWRFRVTAAAGGLVERAGLADYVAPADGYRQSFEYMMPKDPPDGQWSYTLSKSFFVRLKDDSYGVLQVEMVAAGTHFATFRSRMSPVAGSRHLEPPPQLPTKRR